MNRTRPDETEIRTTANDLTSPGSRCQEAGSANFTSPMNANYEEHNDLEAPPPYTRGNYGAGSHAIDPEAGRTTPDRTTVGGVAYVRERTIPTRSTGQSSIEDHVEGSGTAGSAKDDNYWHPFRMALTRLGTASEHFHQTYDACDEGLSSDHQRGANLHTFLAARRGVVHAESMLKTQMRQLRRDEVTWEDLRSIVNNYGGTEYEKVASLWIKSEEGL